MKIAVLSDIHGNYIALQKCMEYALAENITTFLFLGDYLGELAYPQKTMEMLYSIKNQYICHFIRGNKEEYWLNYHDTEKKSVWKDNDSTTGSLLYTYNHVTEKDMIFFKNLPPKKNLYLESLPPLTLCHGSPDRINEDLLPGDENTFAAMEREENSYLVCGHTHIQAKVEYCGKILLNPGAVGMSLQGRGKAQFMILHGKADSWEEEFLSLDYDKDKVIAELLEEELDKKAPCWCKVTEHLLRTGEVAHGTVLARAMALCKEEEGECVWPNVPEKYWEQAVHELMSAF